MFFKLKTTMYKLHCEKIPLNINIHQFVLLVRKKRWLETEEV